MKAIITVGVSASGKSTWARKFVEENRGWEIICRDDIRRQMMGGRIIWAHWNWKHEGRVSQNYDRQVEAAASKKRNIILADTNLSEKFRNQRIESLKALGYEVEIRAFEVSLEEAWKRDAQRDEGVGQSVIYKQYQEWLTFIDRKRYKGNQRLPSAVLVDVDGTLAHMQGRGPFEWHKVHEDSIDLTVVAIVSGLKAAGHQIIVLSGRDGICYESTENWLRSYGVEFDHFFMREAGDQRKDTVIKEEIFWNKIADKFNVVCALDDRPVVCRMWMDLGIKVINVGNPYVEF